MKTSPFTSLSHTKTRTSPPSQTDTAQFCWLTPHFRNVTSPTNLKTFPHVTKKSNQTFLVVFSFLCEISTTFLSDRLRAKHRAWTQLTNPTNPTPRPNETTASLPFLLFSRFFICFKFVCAWSLFDHLFRSPFTSFWSFVSLEKRSNQQTNNETLLSTGAKTVENNELLFY